MIDEALRSLIAFVESASPVVWQAAQQEVAVKIMINTRSMVLFIVLGFLFLLMGIVGIYKCAAESYPDDGWIGAMVFGLIFGVVGLVAAFICWNSVTASTMNPEYQAIKIISEFVTGVCN